MHVLHQPIETATKGIHLPAIPYHGESGIKKLTYRVGGD
jgi:hypothetical protein